jgi:hypothetical protein
VTARLVVTAGQTIDLSEGTHPAREQRHDDELSGGSEV